MAAPHFLNVDLEIESKHDLAVLEAELGKNECVLFGGPASPGCFLLCLEILPEYSNPDDNICALCSLLERLPAKARRAWRSAHKREFDVGYEAVPSRKIASKFSLRADTLKRISNLGATLGVTFYYFPKGERSPPAKSPPPKEKKFLKGFAGWNRHIS
jgi:hypothetical protein